MADIGCENIAFRCFAPWVTGEVDHTCVYIVWSY